ncbi:hypothetical protein [Marispirochaeta aestuarii]|uniref:hypothetical protein n=1 Tax=Marispirochaeta aestuarii TaxID=1963862 RepID=UPI0029C7695A|nr:hypothetical protein [Marispirochaeta aestuarii]
MKKLAEWIEEKAASIEYGTVDVSVKVKNGRIVRIEKSVMESEQPKPKAAGYDRRR